VLASKMVLHEAGMEYIRTKMVWGLGLQHVGERLRPSFPRRTSPLRSHKMTTSLELRWKLIHAIQRGLSLSSAAKHAGVSKKVAKKWWDRFKTTHDVQERLSPGRPPALSLAARKRAHQLLLDGTHGGSAGVARQLHDEGLTATIVHRTTVVKGAVSYGKLSNLRIKCVRGKPKKRLSQPTRLKRLKFAKANLRTNWSTVMFTDRKKFAFNYPGVKVTPSQWVLEGQERQASAVNHAKVFNLYAGLTLHKVTPVHQVAGTSGTRSMYKNQQGEVSRNITTAEYMDVVLDTFLPAGTQIFSVQGISSWVLQQDNDPTHKVANQVIKKWNTKRGSSVSLMPNWPPSSPDLNPIENLWALAQAKVEALGCKTWPEFKEAIERELRNTPQRVLRALVKSMPKRMAQVISCHGDRIKY